MFEIGGSPAYEYLNVLSPISREYLSEIWVHELLVSLRMNFQLFKVHFQLCKKINFGSYVDLMSQNVLPSKNFPESILS